MMGWGKMSKYAEVVEALEELIDNYVSIFSDDDQENVCRLKKIIVETLKQAKKELDELEELKRVPTAEEICKAIQDHLTLTNKVVYNGKNNSFELEYGNPPTYCIPLVEYKEGLVTHYLPFTTPKILILIGRFYEGQVNKNVS